MLTLKIENLNELRSAFASAPARVAPLLKAATIEAGKVIQRTEVKEAPHKTGGLQRSVRLTYFNIGVEIFPTAKYAPYIVTGTRPHEILPRRVKALRFRGSDGQYHYAKRVLHTGTKPNDFVARTIGLATRPVNQIFDNALKKIIEAIQ